MNPALQLASRTFPPRIADLGFTTDLPVDWIAHELPGEEPDFSDPNFFFPLAIVTAPQAVIVFTFAARPAHEDGTLEDWALYQITQNRFLPKDVGRCRIAGAPAVAGEAVQQSEVGPLLVRFAFVEDGDRLLNLTLTAPELLADAVSDAWCAMVRSFTLAAPRGSRFKLEEYPELTPAQPAPDDAPAQEQAKECMFSDFALAADASSLDPDGTINANLRDRGAGLVPNVIATDAHARRATVAAGAILAAFGVPFGWHVIDDGRRTLLLDPGGKIQIHLSLMTREGRGNEALLDAIEAEMRSDYPNPEFMRLNVGVIQTLGARGIADGEQPLEQYHMLHPFRDDAKVLRARVTTTPEKAADACNLAELILHSCDFDMIPSLGSDPEA